MSAGMAYRLGHSFYFQVTNSKGTNNKGVSALLCEEEIGIKSFAAEQDKAY